MGYYSEYTDEYETYWVEFMALFNNRRKKEGCSPTQLYNILSIEIGFSASTLATGVIKFLQENKDKLDLDDNNINIIKKNKVAGPAFLSLTLKTLIQKDGLFVLSYGPAKVISDLVNKIKGEGQVVITTPKKRKWMVNSAITREERPIIYFVNPTEQNVPLLELINRGKFVALHRPQASGKSIQVLQLQDQLNSKGFVCIYLSLEQVNINSIDKFWQTLSSHLHINVLEKIGFDSINSANDFNMMFKKR
ncbi:10658_t:CDS:2 [Gigaspora margarita]|uniref:10658_t:CDS:1 n=1 Tax=Gigaspora margarita TaxID=4874 RepID=A0ABM8W0Y5_GIGMA|nr:10658_t:CDS:2 [Gigaspora margarita]